MTTKEIIAALEGAAKANREDRYREGNIIRLPSRGDIIVTGDLHGQEMNFGKIVRRAQLEANPLRHLILQEIIHGLENPQPYQCHSYRLLAEVAELKVRFPDQVHILLGNHEQAQVSREEVMKNGQAMVRSLNAGISVTFNDKAGIVMQAMDDYILSLPLAVRTANRVWMSHSLPSTRHLSQFDDFILEKVLTLDDMMNDSSLRSLIWDRQHSAECLQRLQKMWDADIFIVGHQPQEEGIKLLHDNLIVIDSAHRQGCFLPFELDRPYGAPELAAQARKLASLM